MAFILRIYRLTPGQEPEGVESLKALAAALTQRAKARVVLCRQVNDSRQVLWVGDAGSEAASEHGRRADVPEPSADGLWTASPPLALGFIDEFYHSPPRPYQVWALEVRVPPEQQLQALKDLLSLSRAARRASRASGFSLYRALDAPGVFVGFLALGWGATPASLLCNGLVSPAVSERIAGAGLWRPLALICELNGARAAERGAGDGRTISPPPFWARSRLPAPEELLGLQFTGRDFV
jgi:hypothetical protein